MPKKLPATKVAKIKADIAEGTPQPEVAKKHRVSRSTVSDIATERSHKDVPWPQGAGPSSKRPGGQRKPIPDYDPTNERILELEAEVAHVTEERNRERRRSRDGLRQKGIFKALVEEMDHRIKPFKPLPGPLKTSPKAKIDEHLVMHLSDGHHDQVITGEETSGLEDYDFNISCARAERYVETVIEWAKDTLYPKFAFPTLWVLAYGDHSSGEIHGHGPRSYYRNQFKNCLAIGQLHALMIRDLAAYFPQVNVVYLPGNHGRRTAKKDYYGAHDNWDYLIAKVTELHSRQHPNTSFVVPNAFQVNLDINGVGFNISHGDDVRSNGGIPWYGMVRRQKGLIALNSLMPGPRVRYFVMGHHHCASGLKDIDGELLINGAWPATDPFSFNAFSGYREPCQWIHGVNPQRGITWRLDVQLKHAAEKQGPKRYKIDGGRDIGPLLLT